MPPPLKNNFRSEINNILYAKKILFKYDKLPTFLLIKLIKYGKINNNLIII